MSIDRERAAAYVQVRRGHLGMTQQQLAEAAGLDTKTINLLESGRRWPRAISLAKLDRALKLKAGSLQAVAEGKRAIPLDDDPAISEAVIDDRLMQEIADLDYLTDDDVDMLRRFWMSAQVAVLEKAREMNRDRANRGGSRRSAEGA